ncbi:MAG: SOS response-associated peptidase family protein [Bacteroidia bacterium]
MCYDLSCSVSIESITDYLPNILIDPQLIFRFESRAHIQGHAYLPHPVVVFENNNYHLRLFQWGLIANYMDTPEKVLQYRRLMLNAKSEKVLDKKSAWYRIRKQRCLVPVTGIYEHREIKGIKNKIPYHVKIKNEKLIFLPGFFNFSPIADPETGEMPGTYTIITRAANSVMMQIHNGGDNSGRMPLFLPFELAQKWLVPDLTDEEIQDILNYEMPSEQLEYHTVFSIRGKTQRPDGKEKNEPFEWQGVPDLVLQD